MQASPSFYPLILVVGLGGLIVLFWVIATSNRFVRLKNLMAESWANIDVALKRRYDLIPNLVETCKAMAAHERSLFERVVQLREHAMATTGSAGVIAQEQNELVRATNQVLARVEAYPELKSSQAFLELQKELVNTEDRIAAARRFYNANVRDFNTMLQTFPSSLVKGNHQPQELFEVENLAVREPVSVSVS